MTTPEPYDRAARRAADNASTAPTGDIDNIVRAVYPDPKVAALKGENTIVADKRPPAPAKPAVKKKP